MLIFQISNHFIFVKMKKMILKNSILQIQEALAQIKLLHKQFNLQLLQIVMQVKFNNIKKKLHQIILL